MVNGTEIGHIKWSKFKTKYIDQKFTEFGAGKGKDLFTS